MYLCINGEYKKLISKINIDIIDGVFNVYYMYYKFCKLIVYMMSVIYEIII